jgi:hypothetical protein
LVLLHTDNPRIGAHREWQQVGVLVQPANMTSLCRV